MRCCHRFVAYLLLLLTLVQSVFIAPAQATPPILDRLFHLGPRKGKPPHTPHDPTVEQLAKHIDWLEHELDHWGTVTAKTPDVWGEARLTKYRHEVEKQLQAWVDKFDEDRLSGAQFVSDQAFMAMALSLSNRADLPTGELVPVPQSVVNVGQATSSEAKTPEGGQPSSSITFNTRQIPAMFGIEGSTLTIGTGIKLEQTEVLNQLKNYHDHLNRLRRINEGDDTSDAPGYSLNLVRIPVSVLPGTHSREGYGAEITVTATPQYGPELLPVAYRDFVINDLVDQLAVPLTRFLNDDPRKTANVLYAFEQYEGVVRDIQRVRQEVAYIGCALSIDEATLIRNAIANTKVSIFDSVCGCFVPEQVHALSIEQFAAEVIKVADAVDEVLPVKKIAKAMRTGAGTQEAPSVDDPQGFGPLFDSIPRLETVPPGVATPEIEISDTDELRTFLNEWQATGKLGWQRSSGAGLRSIPDARLSNVADSVIVEQVAKLAQENPALASAVALGSIRGLMETARVAARNYQSIIPQVSEMAATVTIPSSSTRRSTLPFPPGQLRQIYGLEELAHVALAAHRAFRPDVVNRQVVHITDVQAFLRAELSAAYDMLNIEPLRGLWAIEASGDKILYNAIRRGDQVTIDMLRAGFFNEVGPWAPHSTISILAWTVFVESILLNERLLEDMGQTMAGGICPIAPGVWLPFFGPDPPPEARQVFAEYVRIRWPLKIFTVDPVVDEQNIADVSTIYRQMQLAVALSFAGGQTSASAATQMLRQLQRDTATIDLNRTAVGFSHGDDTFGWRFYPRFQTPPVEGNFTVLFRDLIGGGPTDRQLLRSQQIEPGMRECVALVLMPSFVPSVTFDARGNWFKLARPGHTAMSMSETVEYSRAIQAMRTSATNCVRHAHLYRDGEVERLLRRVHQLDRELPLQTMVCQVPIENTLGGFEIFSSGTRELAPELLGWYGAPGYDVLNGATFFLAGDNFSVHQTSVIAGNRSVEVEQMLSRQVIQVRLPPGLPVLKDERLPLVNPGEYEGYIDVHLATPYGVSGHLLIPAVARPAQPVVPVSFLPGYLRVTAKGVGTPETAPTSFTVDSLAFAPSGPLRIQLPPLQGLDTTPTLTVTLQRQTPTGLVPIVSNPAIQMTGRIDPATFTVVIPPSAMEPDLLTAIGTALNEVVAAEKTTSGRYAFILQGSVNLGTSLPAEPVAGAVSVDVHVVPK